MPKTRSGLDTTDDSICTEPQQSTKRHRKRKIGPETARKSKTVKKAAVEVKQPEDFLNRLSSGLEKLNYYHSKSSRTTKFYDDAKTKVVEDLSLTTELFKLQKINKDYIEEIGVSGLPEEVLLFIDGYWNPLVPFQQIYPYSQADENEDIDLSKRWFKLKEDGKLGSYGSEFLGKQNVVTSKKLNTIATDVSHDLDCALRSTIEVTVDDLTKTVKKLISDDVKKVNLPKLDNLNKCNMKNLGEKLKKFEKRVGEVRKLYVGIMDLFDKAHQNLVSGYKDLTKYLRILKLSTGQITRSETKKPMTRMMKKLMPFISEDVTTEEKQNWIRVYEAIEVEFKNIYKKLSQIHDFNLNLFSELIVLQLSQKIQFSKIQLQNVFDKQIPKISYKKADVKGESKFSNDEKMCTICFGEFEENWTLNLRKLPCGHLFHSACIDQWMRMGKRTCPFCRKDVFEKKDVAFSLLDLNEHEVVNRGFDEIEGEIQEALGRYDSDDDISDDDSYGDSYFFDPNDEGPVDDFPNLNDMFSLTRTNNYNSLSAPSQQNNFLNNDLWEEVMQPILPMIQPLNWDGELEEDSMD